MKVEIKGDTPEKKFKNLERILERISRRMQKKVIGLMPASPVFEFCADPSSDAVARIIFPADGTITKIAVFFGKRGKEDPEIEVVFNEMGTLGFESHAMPIPKKGLVGEVNYSVKAGTRVIARVLNPTEEVGDVWIGFLYEINFGDLSQHKIAIEQFEQLTNGEDYATDEER